MAADDELTREVHERRGSRGRVASAQRRLACAVVALGFLRPAAAQASGFDVPAECGSEVEFRAGLSGLLGAGAERAWPSALVIGRDERGDGYRLRIEVAGETRDLTHADCRVLFRSAVVIAAASVDPTLRADVPPPATPPEPPAPAPKAKEQQTEATRPSEEGPKVEGHLAGGAGVALGVLPGATAAFEVRGGASMGAFGLSLAGNFYFPKSVEAEGRSAKILGVGGRLAASYAVVPAFSVALGLEADWLVGNGRAGIALPDEDSAWALAPTLELTLIPLRTKQMSLELGAVGRVNAARPVFEVTGFGEIYQVPRFGLLAQARAVFHFP
jgi:hypothetical protein